MIPRSSLHVYVYGGLQFRDGVFDEIPNGWFMILSQNLSGCNYLTEGPA
jgi:hypothetical protein